MKHLRFAAAGILIAGSAACDINHDGPFIRVSIESDAGLIAVSTDDRTCLDRGDSDSDGVPNCRDECPNVAEDDDNLRDDDGCPEADADFDGIPDARDSCPDQPAASENVEAPGCPFGTPGTAIQDATSTGSIDAMSQDYGSPPTTTLDATVGGATALDAAASLDASIDAGTDAAACAGDGACP